MRKVSMSVSIGMDVATELAAEAQRRGESLSEVINRILADYVHSQEPQAPARARRSGRVKTVSAQESVEL